MRASKGDASQSLRRLWDLKSQLCIPIESEEQANNPTSEMRLKGCAVPEHKNDLL